MEGVRIINNAEALPEQPNLLEIYANERVEIASLGFSGTLEEAMDLCPVDLSDAHQDDINKYVVKYGNKNAWEISQEHEDLFTQVTEEHGFNKGFIVAETSNKPDVSPSLTITKDLVNKNKLEAEKTATNAMRIDYKIPAKTSQNAIKPEYEHHILEQNLTDSHDSSERKELLNKPYITEQISKPTKEQTQRTGTLKLALNDRAVDNSTLDQLPTPVVASRDPAVLAEVPHKESFMSKVFDFEKASEISVRDHPQTPAEIIEQPPENILAFVLTKDPIEIYSEFTYSLRSLVEMSAIFTQTNETHSLEETIVTEKSHELPGIVNLIAQSLEVLEPVEMEQIAPILQSIVGALHGLELLETRGANTTHIEMVEAQFEQLCTELLEQLGITYDADEIQQFMNVIRDPKLKAVLKLVSQTAPDLENDGTHEAKHLSRAFKGLRDVSSKLHQLLGMVACESTSLVRLG